MRASLNQPTLRKREEEIMEAFSPGNGRLTVKTAPCPAWFSARIVPPWACTIAWLMARPKPLPDFALRLLSAR